METRHPRLSPQGQVSQDDGGLWMKMDSGPEAQSITSGETPQDESKVILPAHAVNSTYYSVMVVECADDVFIPPPPSFIAPLPPAEGSTGAMVNNSSVTLSNGASDATEAKANPSGLDWHHGEKQLMAAQNKVDEVIASTTQTSKESTNIASLSNDKDPTPPTDQVQTSMEDAGCLTEPCRDPSGRHHQDNTSRDRESNEEPGDICRETDAGEDKTKSEDICGLTETDSKLVTENVDCDGAGTNVPSVGVKDDDLESRGPPELLKCNQNKMDSATNQPQVSETPAEMTNDDQEHVDTRSLDYNLTKNDWVRRESSSSETPVPRLSTSEGSEEQGDGNKRIATDIQQGQELLQRLQLVQQRQEVDQETRCEENDVFEAEVDDLTASEMKLTRGDEREYSRLHTSMDEGAKANLKEKHEENESTDSGKARMSFTTMSEQLAGQRITRTDADNSDDDQSDSCVPADSSPVNSHETNEIRSLSARHQFSAAESSMEKQIQEAGQEKQNLQRAGGILNLADNPDVLEIPFKTNILLEPIPPQVGQGQRSDWQFSEKKMQKEISQEAQRELVLVNQGKIPGGYSKGEVRQLKETKLLFEAFQQDNTEGPTRNRKLPTTLIRGHVYPSVLERTRSLEMFSLKSCPIARTNSLRLYESTTSEREQSAESLRSKSPTGGTRDKTRLSPYPKQDKQPRLCRSMDSIGTDVSTSAVDTRGKTREGITRQGSPILKHNPFFKLRPALALQPEVEKDIREAKEREEELRRQRCTLYGENRQNSQEEEKSRLTKKLAPDVRHQSRGKLERVWPPPSKQDQMKSEQTQQEPKVHRAGGQKAPLWQRWESGMINGQPSQEKN
ncbi:uncharacterized protein LOC111223685 [Seriola dumerili]|uniref:uncharacterized protein LOC111223685 n=1 Tax=Seriola dumerili TaxID=41447 RepID=UPI000BBED6BB|nr:uncharacterized protein LOC111223685 [Seriola dumerili]